MRAEQRARKASAKVKADASYHAVVSVGLPAAAQLKESKPLPPPPQSASVLLRSATAVLGDVNPLSA